MRKKYKIDEYEGTIDTNKEYISQCLHIDEADAQRIKADIYSQINASTDVCVSEILLNLLEKYYGKELIFAIWYLGYVTGWLYSEGELIPGRSKEEQEGYL